MKKLLAIIFVFINAISSAQYVDNKINIEIGTGANIPLNNKSYIEDNFSYPSLHGNYAVAIPLYIAIQNKINNSLWLGADFSSYSYNSWKGSELFILLNPKSKLTAYHAVVSYYPKKYQLNIKYGQWGCAVSPGIYNHSLTWANLSNTSAIDTTVYPGSFNETNAEMGFGLIYKKELSHSYGISLKANYILGLVNNPYIVDKTMNTFNFTFCFYFRAFKNKYFLYE